MAYSDDISNLSPDHHWTFDGDFLDSIGSANMTNTGMVTTGSAISEDATNSVYSNGTADRAEPADQADMNINSETRRAMGGWVRLSSIAEPPTSIYKEGGSVNNFAILLGFGNNIIFQAVDQSDFELQVFTDRALQINRNYHLFFRFSGSGYDNEFTAFLDGVELSDADPSDKQPDKTTMAAHSGDITMAASDTALNVGGNSVSFVSVANNYFQHWASWSEANAELTDTEIREELFEKGALPNTTITSGTETAMQTTLDGYADTERGDAPLCIRIEAVTGDGDLSLDADNVTFDELASIHIQYMGTGTLTWRNQNGADASIGSTPNGGTIAFVTEVTVTIKVLDASNFTPVNGAQVLVEAGAGGDLTEGTDILTGATNASGIISTTTFGYTNDQPIKGRVRKGTASPFYETGVITGTITSTGLIVTILINPDNITT